MILAKNLEELDKWFTSIKLNNDYDRIRIYEYVERKLGLFLLPLSDVTTSVCMANSPEVRFEYKETFTHIDTLNYIYAMLHSPIYRERNKELSIVDFAGVPYPKDIKNFWQLVQLGADLRELHLLESSKVDNLISSYPINGDNRVTKRPTNTIHDFDLADSSGAELSGRGKVWINGTQYFNNVPKVAWEFYMGGYRPAQKWLIDQRGRTLSSKDILLYQKIIVALTETHRLIKLIDAIEIE